MSLSPIILFVYNRPTHTRMLLQSLQKCKLSDRSTLIVYADGPKTDASDEDLRKIKEVKAIVKSEKWCKEVLLIERQNNLGLAASIVSGVTEAVNQHGKIIVLEDDLLLSPGFLEYLNEALDCYEHEEKVMHVSAYMYPVKKKLPGLFFLNITSCWGWATWKRAWKYYNPSSEYLLEQLQLSGRLDEYNFNGTAPFYEHLEGNVTGQLETWAIRWNTSVFLEGGACLHPYPSLVSNTGNDGSGTHGSEQVFNKQRTTDFIPVKKIPVIESSDARTAVEQFYRNLSRRKNILERVLNRLF